MFGLHANTSANRRRVVEKWIDGVNNRDISVLAGLMSDDCRIIDSRGDSAHGREDCLNTIRGFFGMTEEFVIHVDTLSSTRDDIIIRGYCTATDPRLTNETHWRARSDGRRMTEWQSYTDKYPVGVIHMAIGDRVYSDRSGSGEGFDR